MDVRYLWFEGPRRVQLKKRPTCAPQRGEVRVRVHLTAISPGTELLLWRGQLPAGLAADATLPALQQRLAYPLTYGYAAAGTVEALGAGVDQQWLGQRVFAFQPHASAFCAPVEQLFPLPENLPWEDALFLPNMETAVNLVMDGRPLLGERVLVLGQGVVGLLTTALLARFPLAQLTVADRVPSRLQRARALGASQALPPEALTAEVFANEGADLTFELSGQPAALNTAIACTGYAGRVVIGSWYGSKTAPLALGGHFHRSRIQLISSQVSTIAPSLRGRWDKQRRFALVWRLLAEIAPRQLITHTLPAAEAANAYRLLDEEPQTAIQILLKWD